MDNKKIKDIKNVFGIIKEVDEIIKKLGPYIPEVQSIRINYAEKNSDITLLLTVPRGIKRKIRKAEIPAYKGYTIYDMYDDSLNRVHHVWEYKDGKWILDANKLPASEKYLLIMKGSISKEALDQIVKVHVPKDPKKEEELDKYWLHSAIKDMSILEKIWEELAVERVNLDVRVAVERYFTASIPRAIKMMLKSRRDLLIAIETRAREKARLESFYRYWSRIARARTGELWDLTRKLVSGEIFGNFLRVDYPYEIGSIAPVTPVLFIPEGVGVGVLTDLNFGRPAAEGYLSFKKKEFSDRVSKDFKKFLR